MLLHNIMILTTLGICLILSIVLAIITAKKRERATVPLKAVLVVSLIGVVNTTRHRNAGQRKPDKARFFRFCATSQTAYGYNRGVLFGWEVVCISDS